MSDIDARLLALVGKLNELYVSHSDEALLACREVFREFVAHPSVAADLVNRELAKLVESPAAIGSWRPWELIIHQEPRYQLSLLTRLVSRQFVHTTTAYEMLAPLFPMQASIPFTFWTLPPEYRNDVFDSEIRIRESENGLLRRGEVLCLRPGQVFDLAVRESACLLRFSSSPETELEWLFSRETNRAWRATDADMRDTQARVSALTLGRLAKRTSVDALLALAAHRNHAVRWTAIQSLGRVSRTAAVEQLEKTASSDPHPHLRKAAMNALAHIMADAPNVS